MQIKCDIEKLKKKQETTPKKPHEMERLENGTKIISCAENGK